MDSIPLIVLVFLGIPTALVIWLIVRAVRAKGHIEELFRRIDTLELDLSRLKREREAARAVEPAPERRTEILARVATPEAPAAVPPPIIAAQAQVPVDTPPL